MLDYQTPPAAQRKPTQEVLDDHVCLTLPSPPRWAEIVGVISSGVTIFSKMALVAVVVFMLRRMGAPVATILSGLFAPLLVLMAALLIATPLFGISLYNVIRFGGTPRRLEVRKGELTYSRRGWLGIRHRHIPAGEVASIRFKPWKNVFRHKSRSGILRITSRDGRRIRIVMNGEAFALAVDAERALRQACGLPEGE